MQLFRSLVVVNTIKENMPDTLALSQELSRKIPNLTATRTNLKLSIDALKSKIDAARATANRIKVTELVLPLCSPQMTYH